MRGPVANARSPHQIPGSSRATLLGVQRVLDIAVALPASIVAVIPSVLIAAAIKATSRGPVLFTQERVGHDGEPFRIYKFRTMRDGTADELAGDSDRYAEYQSNGFKLLPDDPHITMIGRWLRRTSVDELPQLVNVFRGQMSIVGIRPLLAEELALRPAYDQALYRQMRPGVTGLWQVEGRSTLATDDRLDLDRRYLETWSPLSDVTIMLRTPRALLRTSHAH